MKWVKYKCFFLLLHAYCDYCTLIDRFVLYILPLAMSIPKTAVDLLLQNISIYGL